MANAAVDGVKDKLDRLVDLIGDWISSAEDETDEAGAAAAAKADTISAHLDTAVQSILPHADPAAAAVGTVGSSTYSPPLATPAGGTPTQPDPSDPTTAQGGSPATGVNDQNANVDPGSAATRDDSPSATQVVGGEVQPNAAPGTPGGSSVAASNEQAGASDVPGQPGATSGPTKGALLSGDASSPGAPAPAGTDAAGNAMDQGTPTSTVADSAAASAKVNPPSTGPVSEAPQNKPA